VQGVSLLHVVPQKVTGLSGNLEPVKPVLDTVITIEPKERTSYALIEEVCNKIPIATNPHVIFGTVPENRLDNTKTTICGFGKTARSIRGARLSWQLLYSSDEKWGYSLNIRG
jgi:hypothetical protein